MAIARRTLEDSKQNELFTSDYPTSVSSIPHLFNVMRDKVEGFAILDAFGHNAAVGATLETVYQGSDRYSFLAAAEQLTIVSDSADDAAGGTGATEVTLYGLDANYDKLEEAVALDGLTAVTTVGSFLRINRVGVSAAGTGRTNAGQILVQNNAQTDTLEYIQPGEGQSHTAVFTIPAGHTGYVVEWYGCEASNTVTEFYLSVHLAGEVLQITLGAMADNANFHVPLQVPLLAPARSDIEVFARAAAAGANVMAGFDGWYEA